MNFSNRLKGGVTQILFGALLRDVRYRLVPLGVEEVIREAQSLGPEQYRAIGLPKPLRTLPDFFVARADMTNSWLVEVKYRRRWNDEVRAELSVLLKTQVSLWSPLYLVLFLGERARESDTPASSLGVCKLIFHEGEVCLVQRVNEAEWGQPERWVDRHTSWDEVTWGHMSRLQDVFDGIGDRFADETLRKAVSVMRSLGELDN